MTLSLMVTKTKRFLVSGQTLISKKLIDGDFEANHVQLQNRDGHNQLGGKTLEIKMVSLKEGTYMGLSLYHHKIMVECELVEQLYGDAKPNMG